MHRRQLVRPLALGIIIAASSPFVTVACHHDESAGESAGGETEVRAASTPGPHACPMGVKGTSVTANDTSKGVALDFQTTAGASETSELQRRVHAMAEAGSLGMMRGPGAGGGRAGRALSRQASEPGVSRPRTRVEDTARGARVTLEPSGTADTDVAALRSRAHAHVVHMSTNSGCMHARNSP
jgi:hypothetical protein